MDYRTKNIALVSVIAVTAVFGFIIVMGIQISEAQMTSGGSTEKRIGPQSPKSFGNLRAPSPVCGDRLCDAPVTEIDIEEIVKITDNIHQFLQGDVLFLFQQ